MTRMNPFMSKWFFLFFILNVLDLELYLFSFPILTPSKKMNIVRVAPFFTLQESITSLLKKRRESNPKTGKELD